jgi:hypothetical protein
MKEIEAQSFNPEVLYDSYIKYAESKTNLLKTSPSHIPVDPIYSLRTFNDTQYISRLKKKWGVDQKDFNINYDARSIIDSHSTLNNLTKARLNKILDRNIELYLNFAKNQQIKIKNDESINTLKQKVPKLPIKSKVASRL